MPRAYNKPEFGPCAPVAAALLTDWGPVQAKVAAIQGTVKLHVILAKDGSVRQLDVVSGDPQLVESAIKAVKQWKYEPTLLNGQAIEVDTVVEVVFQLRN